MSPMAHPSFLLLASNPETQEAPLPAGHCQAVAKSVSHLVQHWRPADDYNGRSHLTAKGSPVSSRSLLRSGQVSVAPCAALATADDHNGRSLHLTARGGPATFLRPPASALPASPPCAFGPRFDLRLALVPPPLPRLLRPPASALPSSPPCAFNRTCAIPHVTSDKESSCFNHKY